MGIEENYSCWCTKANAVGCCMSQISSRPAFYSELLLIENGYLKQLRCQSVAKEMTMKLRKTTHPII
jgi:hypothetical protein